MWYLANQGGQTERAVCPLTEHVPTLRRGPEGRLPGATLSTGERGRLVVSAVPVRDSHSCLVSGQWSDGGAAGAAVPPHHLQHRPPGLQEDPGESLSDGLDPQHVRGLLLKLPATLRSTRPLGGAGRGGDLGWVISWKGFNCHMSVCVPECVYLCFVRILPRA